ncbi:ABC transporter ATP-binding protein [Vibrio sp. VB16]|uniref:ABC transporter ATP-binding protein n=1 Tax=Vibrio sp. VB16 TaxID=2785746 RepID=UPI00189C8D4D|nr:ABC transporter ATP-binding protein [Vibrio sp. VB16]UGA53590.1 ABC transporter ATP-binding protein [Vibrio sp. VB16]
MAELILDNVSKNFDDQTVVDKFSLTIPEGAFCALLGPSGCGKTTTLRMIAGLDNLTSGKLMMDKQILDNGSSFIPPEKRQMSMVFQSYALWPHMTVKENVAYPLKVQRQSAVHIQTVLRRVLETVDMEKYANRRVQDLSGGQRQRVALARCLVAEPKVVLLDEPLANLDRHLRSAMEQSFREFHRKTGATFVFVTHDQAEAMALATHVAVMNQGRLIQSGTPESLYQQPESSWLAGFIGKGSVLNLPIKQYNRRKLDARDLELSSSVTPLPVLLRPEHVVIAESGISAIVKDCVFLGERYLLTLSFTHDQQSVTCYHNSALPLNTTVYVELEQGWRVDVA